MRRHLVVILALAGPLPVVDAAAAAAAAAAAQIGDMSDFNLKETVKGLPGMIQSNFRQFKKGTSLMWQNGKAAKVVRNRVRAEGGSLAYSELQLLRKSGEDTTKLVQAGFVWLFIPELFPALLYFYPNALPSTFESEEGRAKRHASLARMRTRACLELLGTLEEQAATRTTGKKGEAAANAIATAELTLRARSSRASLAYLQGCAKVPTAGEKAFEPLSKIETRIAKREAKAAAKPTKAAPSVGKVSGAGKAALLGLSQPCLKAGCKLIGVSGPQPGPLRRGALGKHMEMLIEQDAVLARTGTASLTRAELAEACLDRGFGSDRLTDAQLRSLLDNWLTILQSRAAGGAATAGETLEPHRVRLAAMAACASSAVRSERESMSVLPRLLYSK